MKIYKEYHYEEAFDDHTECAAAADFVLNQWKTIGSFTDAFITDGGAVWVCVLFIFSGASLEPR